MTEKPNYPNLNCKVHGLQKTGYIICSHIKEGHEVDCFEEGTDKQLGVIACSACYEALKSHPSDEHTCHLFTCICIACATESGFLVTVQ